MKHNLKHENIIQLLQGYNSDSDKLLGIKKLFNKRELICGQLSGPLFIAIYNRYYEIYNNAL